MSEELTYSTDALLNRVLFLSDNNEINIFVEDVGKEYEYENIFSRLFGNILKIKKIFAMGGKPGVEKALDEYGDIYKNKPNIYIVDGDFDAILEKKSIHKKNYIYLDKYNIESYFVDKNVILQYMCGKLKDIKNKVEEEIEYDEWRRNTYNNLEKLFLAYVIAQSNLPEDKNVGICEYTYLNEQGCIDISKINDYIIYLKSRLANYDELFTLYYKKYCEILDADSSRLVCGKYIICSLVNYLRKKTNKSFKEEDFRYYLVSGFDIHQLDYIKHIVLDIVEKVA